VEEEEAEEEEEEEDEIAPGGGRGRTQPDDESRERALGVPQQRVELVADPSFQRAVVHPARDDV
jgi:hypothetical protein